MARVDEERQASPDKVQCVLDLQLKIAHQLEVLCQAFGFQPGLQAIQQQRSKRIVATAWIAAGEYNDRSPHHIAKHAFITRRYADDRSLAR